MKLNTRSWIINIIKNNLKNYCDFKYKNSLFIKKTHYLLKKLNRNEKYWN